jgi:hypothetical protein
MDDEFWFKRSFVLGYWPIKWQGWATAAMFWIYALGICALFIWLGREGWLSRDWVFWSFAMVNFSAFLGFFSFVHLRTRLD